MTGCFDGFLALGPSCMHCVQKHKPVFSKLQAIKSLDGLAGSLILAMASASAEQKTCANQS
jgi:hypothetical protein